MNDNSFVNWIRRSTPYIAEYRSQIFVVMLGDKLVASGGFHRCIRDLALLNMLGMKLVIVFSANIQIGQSLNSYQAKQINDLSVTNKDAMETIKKILGALQIEIQALLSMKHPDSPSAKIQTSAICGNYIIGKPSGVVEGVDLKFSGKVRKINHIEMKEQLDCGKTIIVPPLGYSLTGEVFFLDAYEMATEIAMCLQADKLIFLCDDSIQTEKQLTIEQAKGLISKQKMDSQGIKNLRLGVNACQTGVRRVHYIDQNIEGGILQEILSRDGVGTLLSNTSFDVIRKATIDDISGIFALIEPLEQKGILIKRSREKIELDIDNYIVLLRDEIVQGCVALQLYQEKQMMELACLVVHPEYQGKTRGDALYQFVETSAKQQNVKTIFVLTTQAEHWFIERGFEVKPLDYLPVDKQQTYNYKRNSKLLVKEISF